MTTETRVTEPSTFKVFDGQRYMNVHGWELASADTQQGRSVRWTEMSLYRSGSGKYVLEKVGRSDVYHTVNCSQNSKGVEFADLETARTELTLDDGENREFSPCVRCMPGSDPRPLYAERDIFSVSIFENAKDLIESLFKPGTENARFLTRIGRELLAQASERDSTIAQLINEPVDIL